MLYVLAPILVIGAVLGLFVRVKVIVVIAALCLLIGLAASPFISAEHAIAWIAAAAALQCGYFIGLLIQAWLLTSRQTRTRVENRIRAWRSTRSKNDAS